MITSPLYDKENFSISEEVSEENTTTLCKSDQTISANAETVQAKEFCKTS